MTQTQQMTQPQTITITRDKFFNILVNWNKGAQPVSMVTETLPKVKKETKQQYGIIKKHTYYNCFFGTNYEAAVSRRLEKEGKDPDFQTETPVWMEKINNVCGHHKTDTNKRYVIYSEPKPHKKLYFDIALNMVEEKNIMFYATSKPKKQGLDKPFKYRTVKLENVKTVTLQNKKYVLID